MKAATGCRDQVSCADPMDSLERGDPISASAPRFTKLIDCKSIESARPTVIGNRRAGPEVLSFATTYQRHLESSEHK